MVFEIQGKVALITGGASGLGLQYALALLEKGLKGVTLADVAVEAGNEAIADIERRFGKNKAIFVKTDVTNYEQFEEAFRKTIGTFKNIDILINNAGILNDQTWQKEVAINVNGVIHGMLLALYNYIPKYKTSSEGLIVNISSIAGIEPFSGVPIYTGTKFAVHGMTLAWGSPSHYEQSKVRVVAVCPGVTDTPLITNLKMLDSSHELAGTAQIKSAVVQTPEQTTPNVIEIIEKAPSGTAWVVEGGEKPYQYILAKRSDYKKNHLP